MRGRMIPLSRPRRLIGDLMYFAAGVPTVPVQRRMRIAPLVAARTRLENRPTWTAIFTKAFALVAAQMPELRRAYCKCPWPHLYEFPSSVAAITIEREIDGEPAVLSVRIKDPGSWSLAELTTHLHECRNRPWSDVKDFRRLLSLARWPRPIRRLIWWLGLNLGRQRSNYFGTFGVSVYSALGAESLHPLSPLTTTINYGIFADDGGVDVRFIYDHRVMDGATVARALVALENVLLGPIQEELLSTGSYEHSEPNPELPNEVAMQR